MTTSRSASIGGRARAGLGDDRLVVRLVVAQVAPDRPVPVDVAVARAARDGRPVERPGDGLPQRALQAALDVLDDLADDRARGRPGLGRHDPAERDQLGRELQVRLDVASSSGSRSIRRRFSRSSASCCMTDTTDDGK